jgi:CTP:molybdopterin cytidylyltransferase MocA
MTVAGLVLAAGEGRRLGQPKALLVIEGERLVDRAVRVARDGGCDGVYVVAGATALDVDGATVLDNPDWSTGMGSSVRLGLSAVTEDAVLVMVVDTPGIGSAVVRRLVAAFERGATVVVAAYDGQPRNPVLLAREHWAAVAELAVGDVGARAFLATHPDLVTYVECGDVGEPSDLDTPGDWARFSGS